MDNGQWTMDHGLWKKIGLVFCLWFMVYGLWSGCSPVDKQSKICFQKQCFTIEIADTDQERQQGLMFRENMPDDHGMWFVFGEDNYYSFWMKNTLIPLDMIWLDKGLKVVHIEEFVAPCKKDPCPSYATPVPARYVLELNAGIVQEIALEVGHQGYTLSPYPPKRWPLIE